MIRHIIFIAILFAFGNINAQAADAETLAKLKAKELDHKCDILKRLKKSTPTDDALKAQREHEVENLEKEIKAANKSC